ncbi:hypothetical protein [Sandaracinus amylolyticus]|uniref:hypothetical protein n=1 Tax=Sandaracinus amylolyticus TaxID=927083 RepID=UPI0012EE5B78|nr:hypothetical protein [Sandaracinus amylolyticus]
MGSAAAWRCARAWIHDVLIVPAAHTRVLDGDLQTELYEVFHTRPIARWGHALCTPVINVALLALCAEVTVQLATRGGHTEIDGAIAGAAIALAFYVAVHGAWALVMAPLLALAVLGAHGLREVLGAHAVSGAIVIALGAVWVQTLSHVFEPVPPPWSRAASFGTVRELWERTSIARIVALAVTGVLVFPVLELWASPRVWPLQIAHAMRRLGWKHGSATLEERVRTIHRDARAGWSVPVER